MQDEPIFNSGNIFLQHPVPKTKFSKPHPLEKHIMITFPGSSEDQDWKDNYDVAQKTFQYPLGTKWKGTRVMRGMWRGMQKVWPRVKYHLRELRNMYPDYTITVSGHSRGAKMFVNRRVV